MTNKEGFVEVKLLFFGKTREIIGEEMSTKYLPNNIKIKELYSLIFEQHCPLLLPIKNSCILAVDQTYLDISNDEEIILHGHSEIAIIPPISGG
ncbi:hypothetical protein Mgra_00008905 [Meloidogyne graminicola]|uniref:Molybdopterin synthase sulfur carrier subunit n=1 Tax=Meloidogyne graminicola TaxID=189291 RepID=A0A8S9ZEI5_9BILA|nr:hypothetical protein Mgra_00008905 [Meloidogyne graminicola]